MGAGGVAGLVEAEVAERPARSRCGEVGEAQDCRGGSGRRGGGDGVEGGPVCGIRRPLDGRADQGAGPINLLLRRIVGVGSWRTPPMSNSSWNDGYVSQQHGRASVDAD